MCINSKLIISSSDPDDRVEDGEYNEEDEDGNENEEDEDGEDNEEDEDDERNEEDEGLCLHKIILCLRKKSKKHNGYNIWDCDVNHIVRMT